MSLKHVKGDLFTSRDHLCHCVSADFRMGAGIAVKFKEMFGNQEQLQGMNLGPGQIAVMELEDNLKTTKKYIYYLVTKDKYFQKPTYGRLRACLQAMRKHMDEHHVTRVSMPKIGCGLDKLNWNLVEDMIRQELSGIHITVYSL